jgi:SAM-dependent methyltransferase
MVKSPSNGLDAQASQTERAPSPDAAGPRCRICGADRPQPFAVREMMFGSSEEFTYLQCRECGCLQIERIPDDLECYYPAHYYSLEARNRESQSGVPDWCLTMGDLLGDLMLDRAQGRRPGDAARIAVDRYFGHLGLSRSARILDVGCGSGSFLLALREQGFENLLGVDPFLAQDLDLGEGVRVLRAGLEQLETEWDLMMFHHSFEHVPDPAATLRQIARLLAPGGVCLLRMPVVPCEAWERYGPHWVQLDAPRHIFIHSAASLSRLLEPAGLRLDRVVHDSGFLQFVGSEQNRRGIPLVSERSFATHPEASIFTSSQIGSFIRQAKWLNAQGRGDQAAFYLRAA